MTRRVYIGLDSHETNTMSPLPTGLSDFRATYLREGLGTAERNVWTAPLMVWRDRARERGWQVAEGLIAKAVTSGRIVRSTFEHLCEETLRLVAAAMPLDAVMLYLHGSMVAEGYDDCEGELLERVRELVGPGVRIAVEYDLHAHMSPRRLALADISVLYKEYPHDDYAERAEEVFALLAQTLDGEVEPVTEFHDCRMLGLFPTKWGAMKRFVDRMRAHEGRDGILSVSLTHGFYWGDVPEEGVKVIVVADRDREKAAALARELGEAFIAIREQTRFEFITVAEGVERIAAATSLPVVLADFSDGQSGGGPGDSTFILAEILRRGLTGTATGIVWDPLAVRTCMEAGVGARLTLRLGGKVGAISGDPLDLDVLVRRIEPEASFTNYLGTYHFGPAVVVETGGNLVVVSDKRIVANSPALFEVMGIDPRAQRGIVLKAQQAFKLEFAPIAGEMHIVTAPGACQLDISKLPLKRVRRPIWPLDPAIFEDRI